MNARPSTDAALPLTRIVLLLSFVVIAWGLFVFTHVWVIVFYWLPVVVGITMITFITEGIARHTRKQVKVSRRTVNLISIVLVVCTVSAPLIGFLVGYAQVEMVRYGIGIDARMLWQDTTLLSQWSDIAPDRYIRAEFHLIESPDKARNKIDGWVRRKPRLWTSGDFTSGGYWWTCTPPQYGDSAIDIQMHDGNVLITVNHNAAWKCMIPSTADAN